MTGAQSPFNVRNFAYNAEQVTLAGGNGFPEVIAPAGSISWRNIPHATFMVYAFANATETNPELAVSTFYMGAEAGFPLAPDYASAANNTFSMWVVFDPANFDPPLPQGTYTIRIQAISPQNVPVRGMEPMVWGADSPISTQYVVLNAPEPPPAMTMSAVAAPAGMSRATGWDHVEGAGSFRVYAFNNRDAAVNATAATVRSLAAAWATIPATGERIATDARMIVFEGPATRALPEGFKPAGLGASMPAAGSENGAYETNLVPDQYWFRVMAIPANRRTHSSSELSAVHTATQSFNIAMGPDEARAYIEGRLDDIGTTLRLIDIRFGATESGNEGFLRFFEPPGMTSTINNQANANNLLLQGGLTPEEVTVMLL